MFTTNIYLLHNEVEDKTLGDWSARTKASRFPGISITGSSHPLGEATLLSPLHEAETNPTLRG